MQWIKRIALAIVGLLICFAIAAYVILRSSLPQLNGSISLAGIKDNVTLERDALGVVTITATDRADLAFATGYAHGQDRLFQMDLLRRESAGELAELLGKDFVKIDKRFRRHAFRKVAQQVLALASVDERQTLDAYAAGVNAARSAMHTRPFEYLLLRTEPAPWRAEDSILCAFAMYIELNDSEGTRELERARLHAALPQKLFDFLYPAGTQWDAPLDGADLSTRRAEIPGPEIIDLRKAVAVADKNPQKNISQNISRNIDQRIDQNIDQNVNQNVNKHSREDIEQGDYPGSNNWAVSGARTASGAALVANDMHLSLRVPNIWYRARMIVKSNDKSRARDLIGVTLPGLPVLVAGSNGNIAWGFTNSDGDFDDLVLIDSDASHPNQYRDGDNFVNYTLRKERINVRGDKPVEAEYRDTIWGPLLEDTLDGHPLALAWTAQHPEATNLHHFQLEAATSVQQALPIANSMGIPVQNFVVADRNGHIGWTLAGQLPKRQAINTHLPLCWGCAPTAGWSEFLAPQDYPRIVDPLEGQLWSANSRTLGDARAELLGDEGMDRGARASQIRDDLTALTGKASTHDMLSIQLDDRAIFLSRWRDTLLRLLDDAYVRDHPARLVTRNIVQRWSAHAATDDAGYRIVREFRNVVQADIYGELIAAARAKYPDAKFKPSARFEDSLWQIITTQPANLLAAPYTSWDEELLASLDRAIELLKKDCGDAGDSLSKCTWGKRNTLQMQHPLAAALPLLGRFLSMPRDQLPGDHDMPRVQEKSFGASERFAVSPGHEAEGYFHMPGGQSGNPLSPFFSAGHKAWVKGEPTPLLPGETRYTLKLAPLH